MKIEVETEEVADSPHYDQLMVSRAAVRVHAQDKAPKFRFNVHEGTARLESVATRDGDVRVSDLRLFDVARKRVEDLPTVFDSEDPDLGGLADD